MKKIIYTAAHSGFNLGEVPLGGGAAICQHLVQEWMQTRPFEWKVLGPSLLGSEAPRHKDLVRYSELEYARFCRQFEARLTETILQNDPRSTVVLCNDVSEGPDFALLASKGYPIFTIYHVDVVDYFSRIYLRGWIKPESATRFYRWMFQRRHPPRPPLLRHPPRPLAGDPSLMDSRPATAGNDVWYRQLIRILGLVFQKQQDSVRYSKGLIVPSNRMKEVLLREYPDADKNKIHVLPWGAWDDPAAPEEVAGQKEALRKAYPSDPESWKLLMLSRISPEKGQDRLLNALALWEARPDFPKEGIALLISGEAAYMMGKRYEGKLKRLASRLKRSRVHFVGYAPPARKKALFELTDLYVFPSRHESYGLTLLEALRAGLPVLATPSHGAQEVFQPEFGEMIPYSRESEIPRLLIDALKRLLSNRAALKEMGNHAKVWASGQNFSDTAARLAQLLIEN
jgi:glycosyltransferase involved in cell wall biosynthesis